MKTVYIISNKLNTLDANSVNTSSAKYEYNLSKYLSRLTKVVILTLGLNDGEVIKDGTLELVGVDKPEIKEKSKETLFVRKLKTLESGVVIFWGYLPLKLLPMLYLKIRRLHKCIQFVYDSHKPAIQNYSSVKKMLLNAYFGFGKMLSRFFDGYIFFQDMAAKRLKVEKKPYIVIKPGVDSAQNYSPDNNDSFLVSYCGTFSVLNGIDVFLKALPYFKDLPVTFEFYGYGLLEKDVEKTAQEFPYFKYGGVVTNEDVTKIYERSSLLINLRLLDDEAMDFAFPSKAFECISTGIPVLTTPVLKEKEFLEGTVVIEDITPEEIYNKIKDVYENKDFYAEKALKARDYVLDKYSFENSAREIFSFIDGLK